MSIKFSKLNENKDNDSPLNMTIRLSLDLPTLILISVFSAFAYYLSRLNLEVETILHDLDEPININNAFDSRSNRRTATVAGTLADQSAGDQSLHVYGGQIRENTTGFAKMFFFIANVLLFIFYVACFAKCKFLKDSLPPRKLTVNLLVDYDKISVGESEKFEKWVRTFTGMSFLVLGVSILKYGSQLETTITHAINLKSALATQLEGLDVRILSITILLSLVFLARALVDCMFAFDLINEQLNSFVMLICIIISTEVVTSFVTVKLMRKGSRLTEQELPMPHDSHFHRAKNG